MRPFVRPGLALALTLAALALPAAAAPPPLLPEETVAALAAELSGTNSWEVGTNLPATSFPW